MYETKVKEATCVKVQAQLAWENEEETGILLRSVLDKVQVYDKAVTRAFQFTGPCKYGAYVVSCVPNVFSITDATLSWDPG